jgi:hypothetical protein
LIDPDLRLDASRYRVVDLVGGSLGRLESFDQWNIAENVLWRIRKPFQQLIL